jgi:uncharacterized membrane protein
MTLAALILGLVLAQINVRPDGFLDPVLFHGSAEEARRLLLSVATATVGVFAIVVGLTLVALQVAANRYSPRLVRSFLRDRPTQVVLSLFMATFAYNAAGLYTVSAEDPSSPMDYPRLAVSAGLLLLFACIAALVYYVDPVAHSIQIHSILHNIGAAARRAIVAQPPGVGRASGELDVGGESWERPPPWAVQLIAQESGYVQRMHTATLVQAAAAEDSVIKLVPGIGALVKLLRSVGAITKPERLDLVREQLELVRSTAERSIQEPHDLELVLSNADEALLALGRA